MSNVNGSEYIPMYYRLKQAIIEKIQNGEYKPDQKIPTEDEFCEEYGMSKAPVRQALAALVNENYIYKIRGKGSFVLSGYVKQSGEKLQSFTDEIIELGYKPGFKFIEKAVTEANTEIARNLGIETGSKVLYVVRLRTINNEIYSLNHSYFSLEQYPELIDADFNVLSICKECDRVLGGTMTIANVTLEATSTTSELSAELERPVGSPLLLMQRVTYYKIKQVEKPLEFVRVYFVPDKYKFEVVLKSDQNSN